MSRAELMAVLELADWSHFLKTYLHPSLDAGLIEMTLPQSPRSRNQQFRLTVLGRAAAALVWDDIRGGTTGPAVSRRGAQKPIPSRARSI